MNNIYSEKVILPCADPIITSYPHHACYMSILGNEEKYACAILDAYIPLAYNATYKRLDFSIGVDIVEFMENLPFLEAEYITRKEFHDSRVSYVSHIKGAIANGFYVYLLIDYYFVSADKDVYLQKHRIHDVFIYGFDDVNQAFLAKDFLNGRKYMGFLISYIEMEKACDIDLEKDWLRGIKKYRRKTVIHEEISFHPWVIRKEILDYVQGRVSGYVSFHDIRKRQDCEYYYGLNIYEELVKECHNSRKYNYVLDIRIFHILYEHKKCLSLIVQKLCNGRKLKNYEALSMELDQLTNLNFRIRTLALLYNRNKSERRLQQITDLLLDTKEKEEEILLKFAKSILDVAAFDTLTERREMSYRDMCIEYDGPWQKKNDIAFVRKEGAYLQTLFWGNYAEAVLDEHDYEKNQVQFMIDGHPIDKNRIIMSFYENGEVLYTMKEIHTGYHKFQLVCMGKVCSVKKMIFGCKDVNEDAAECSSSVLLSMDTDTKGDWNKKYGMAGYYIAGGNIQLPDYLTRQSILFKNSYVLVWDEDSKDRRALLNVSEKSEAGRIMAYQEHEKEIWINLIIPGSQKRNVSLYFVDYERWDTDLRIKAFSKYDHTVYWNQELKHIDEGVYVSLLLVGDVIISVKKEKGRLAVISGIFFQD